MSDDRPHIEIVNRTGKSLIVEAADPAHRVNPRLLADGQTQKVDLVHLYCAGVRVRGPGGAGYPADEDST